MTGFDAIVITAMAEEAAPFLERASSVGDEVMSGNAGHRRLRLADRDVLLVRSGIGLVNAAGAATSAILAARSEAPGAAPTVISAGSAGGIGAEVRVGDVVVGEEYINVDADARAFGYPLGQVPRMPLSYHADAAALKAIGGRALRWGEGELTVRQGLVVSSYSFVTPERAATIAADFPRVQATDMESSAIAQTSHVHGVPFVSVRGISDLCAATEFDAHIDDAAERSAAVVSALVSTLPS